MIKMGKFVSMQTLEQIVKMTKNDVYQELGQPDLTGGPNFCSDKLEKEGTGGDLVRWLSSSALSL